MKASGPSELPIIFTADSVRAILASAKTQTRRIIKELPDLVSEAHDDVEVDFHDGAWKAWSMEYPEHGHIVLRPRFRVGDVLLVKEAWKTDEIDEADGIRFRADGKFIPIANTQAASDAWIAADRRRGGWRSPLYMPRWASRISLEVTDVRAQRVQEISEEDAVAEGFSGSPTETPREQFSAAWDRINGRKAPCSSNPWVFAYTFRRIEK